MTKSNFIRNFAFMESLEPNCRVSDFLCWKGSLALPLSSFSAALGYCIVNGMSCTTLSNFESPVDQSFTVLVPSENANFRFMIVSRFSGSCGLTSLTVLCVVRPPLHAKCRLFSRTKFHTTFPRTKIHRMNNWSSFCQGVLTLCPTRNVVNKLAEKVWAF